MAAVQLARWLGAEVWATASESKWSVVRGLGVAGERIASSRSVGFAEVFGRGVGSGVDVVVDSLAGELVDASLGLVRPGGRFVELGKADVRDPGEVAAAYEGVMYRAFDLAEVAPERLGRCSARWWSCSGPARWSCCRGRSGMSGGPARRSR
ncbi:zinc-binding dehydrogenase [Streptomyces olivaceus]|uniref:zinc-binding dehydrogenase n=1 Tax=Streptomyces olivaceus TaxID=47716 RepID=UPI001D175966|nr:zinc-binding dehydrogenase [Streptomyces olivaceus]